MGRKTRAQLEEKLDENIKLGNKRRSPLKTTGIMLKECFDWMLPFYNNIKIEEYGSVTKESAEAFVKDPEEYPVENLSTDSTLTGENANEILELIRALANKISKPTTSYFDREARFIVGRELTNGDLRKLNWASGWFVANGKNGTDDMRGRYIAGGGENETVPFERGNSPYFDGDDGFFYGKDERYASYDPNNPEARGIHYGLGGVKLKEQHIPELRPYYKSKDLFGSVTGEGQVKFESVGVDYNNGADGSLLAMDSGFNWHPQKKYANFYNYDFWIGRKENYSIKTLPPTISGTWIQYVDNN